MDTDDLTNSSSTEKPESNGIEVEQAPGNPQIKWGREMRDVYFATVEFENPFDIDAATRLTDAIMIAAGQVYYTQNGLLMLTVDTKGINIGFNRKLLKAREVLGILGHVFVVRPTEVTSTIGSNIIKVIGYGKHIHICNTLEEAETLRNDMVYGKES